MRSSAYILGSPSCPTEPSRMEERRDDAGEVGGSGVGGDFPPSTSGAGLARSAPRRYRTELPQNAPREAHGRRAASVHIINHGEVLMKVRPSGRRGSYFNLVVSEARAYLPKAVSVIIIFISSPPQSVTLLPSLFPPLLAHLFPGFSSRASQGRVHPCPGKAQHLHRYFHISHL